MTIRLKPQSESAARGGGKRLKSKDYFVDNKS